MDGWDWMTIGVSVVFLSSLVIADLPGGTKTEIRLCDKAVSAVLSSTDPVELQRAGIIIRNLRCGIGLRLDDTGGFKPRASR